MVNFLVLGLPGGSVVKNASADAGDAGSMKEEKPLQ